MEAEEVMRRFFLIIAICTGLLWSGPVGADEAFDRAYAAYKRGDYAVALDGFRLLAVKGVAEAQNNLGLMYRNGKGVPFGRFTHGAGRVLEPRI